MAQFSIKEAVKFSFAAYGKHVVLLLSASALVGASLWLATVAPRYISQKLGIEHHLIRQDINAAGVPYDEAKADPSTITQQKTEGMIARISARPLESGALILVTIFAWALFLMLLLGCMKLGLSLVDKNAGSLRLMFQISARQMMRFMGAASVFGVGVLIVVAFFLLPIFTCFMMSRQGPPPIAILLVFGLILGCTSVALFAWILRSFFFGFCIVDKPTIGMFDALGMSSEMAHGSRWRIITALLIFTLLVLIIGYFANAFILMSGMVGVIGYAQEVTRFACVLLIAPFSISYFSYIYRSLTRKA